MDYFTIQREPPRSPRSHCPLPPPHRWLIAGLLPITLLMVSIAVAAKPDPDNWPKIDTRPADERPWLGLAIRQDPDTGHHLVAWIYPGPLEGSGFEGKAISRGDRLLAVNGDEDAPARLAEFVRNMAPGDVIRLKVQHTEGQHGAVPQAGEGEDITTFEVELGSYATWAGPRRLRPPGADRLDFDALPGLPTEDPPLARYLRQQLAEHELSEPVERLHHWFARRHHKRWGYHLPLPLSYAFRRPMRITALVEAMEAPLGRLRGQPLGVLRVWADNSPAVHLPESAETRPDAKTQPTTQPQHPPTTPPVPELEPTTPLSFDDPQALAQRAVKSLVQADQHMQRALAGLDAAAQARVRRELPAMIHRYARLDWLDGNQAHRRLIAAMHNTMALDRVELLRAMAAMAAWTDAPTGKVPDEATPMADDALPHPVRAAVSGDVLACVNWGGDRQDAKPRWLVVGGSGDNTYDMDRLAAVIDAGGSDTYRFAAAPPRVQAILDAAGDDRYLAPESGSEPGTVAATAPIDADTDADADDRQAASAPAPGFGPCAAVLSLSLIHDVQGQDEYRGRGLACGAAVAGVALLLDRDGADEYHARHFAQGAAGWGYAAAIDLGGGHDLYEAAVLSQGVGLGGGVGLLFNAHGNEFYRANGPVGSAYGEAATFYGMSQGVGFGLRTLEVGGVGILCDLAGRDRYEAGEFSQGGGYGWGLGLLSDRGGSDLYFGDRYAQGYGCHHAVGLLHDHRGHDTYWSQMAMGQGAAWDFAIGLLWDDSGNDAYRGAGLSQGSGSMQGIGWLLDLAGQDNYAAHGGSSQGMPGSNFYSGALTGAHSFALLLDAGGDADAYSANRNNNDQRVLRRPKPENPPRGQRDGLHLDLPDEAPWDEESDE